MIPYNIWENIPRGTAFSRKNLTIYYMAQVLWWPWNAALRPYHTKNLTILPFKKFICGRNKIQNTNYEVQVPRNVFRIRYSVNRRTFIFHQCGKLKVKMKKNESYTVMSSITCSTITASTFAQSMLMAILMSCYLLCLAWPVFTMRDVSPAFSTILCWQVPSITRKSWTLTMPTDFSN